MTITQGIYPDMDNETYHGHKESLSRSSIRDFADCPYKYWALHLNPLRPPKTKTPDMIFGSAFHTFILENDKFDDEYFILPEKVFKKDDREQYEINKALEEEAEKTSKIVLSRANYKTLCEMRDCVMGDARARELIEGAIYESSYFWKDEGSGLMVKARPDILHRNMIVDLKTIKSASVSYFRSAMVSGGYHIQGGMTRDAVRTLEERDITNVINICVEKDYPISIGIYIIDEAAIEVGQSEYKHHLKGIRECIETNKWPSYAIETVGLPKWYA